MKRLSPAFLLGFTAFAAFLVVAAIGSSCSVRGDAAPGTPCDLYNPCPSSLICVDGRCTTTCNYVGDCDPDYLCVNKVCAPRCVSSEDCEATPCNPSRFQDASYCGRSLVPICAEPADCPAGWRCITGGSCIETCSADAQCLASEACREQGTYGVCRRGERPGDFDVEEMDAGMPDVGSPNNIPLDRNCRDKERGYCEETFGQYQICYQDTCITAPRTVLVLDVSQGSACEPGDGETPAGGIDIVSVHDGLRDGYWATVSDIVVRDGGASREPILVKTGAVDACTGEVGVSTGCGGWVALTARVPIEEGAEITVAESDGACGDSAIDRYRVWLCTSNREVVLSQDTTSCTILLGEGTGTRTFTVTY